MSQNTAVFLSYASEDVEAAERIANALSDAGIEVWFDKSELMGGDAWDQKIRRQIKECTLFVPIISANTQARSEGYFRLEWKLAADRTHLMADDHPFLFPVVVDETTDGEARVPDRFRERQWMRLDQTPPEAIARRMAAVLSGDNTVTSATTPSGDSVRQPSNSATYPAATQSPWKRFSLYTTLVLGLIAVGYVFIRPALVSKLQSLEDTTPAPEVSEVERLLQRADDLIAADALSRADLVTAIELCQAVTEIEPLNAEAWAMWSRACNAQIFYRFDNSAENKTRAREYSDKAMRLDPQSVEARFAQAQTWLTSMEYNAQGPDLFNQVMTTLGALHQEDPDNPKVILTLGNLLTFLPGSQQEGLTMLTDLAEERPDWSERAWNGIGWGHFFRREFSAAQEAAAKALSDNNHPPALMLNSMLQLQWTGDLDAALTFLDRLPVHARWEDWMLAQRVRTLMWRGEPDEVLGFMSRFTRDWVDSQIFDGPKAWLTAEARRTMGLEMAAKQDYERALQLVEARFEEQHQEPNLLTHRILILHRLGRLDEAREAYELQQQLGFGWLAEWALFEPERVYPEIESTFEAPDFWRTAATLRHLDWYEPVRDTPEFQALLARAEASPAHTPNPKSE